MNEWTGGRERESDDNNQHKSSFFLIKVVLGTGGGLVCGRGRRVWIVPKSIIGSAGQLGGVCQVFFGLAPWWFLRGLRSRRAALLHGGGGGSYGGGGSSISPNHVRVLVWVRFHNMILKEQLQQRPKKWGDEQHPFLCV